MTEQLISNLPPWNNGQPKFFSVVGSQIEFVPFPDGTPGSAVSFPIELAYYQRQSLGPNDTDTTAVLTTYPAIYIYGCLMQSAPFIRDDPRVQTWASFYTNAINGANAEHERMMQRIGLDPEGRKFTPHVTLARLHDVSSRDVADYLSVRGYFPSRVFTADRFVLFSSRASTGGGPYVVEDAYTLSA